MRSTSLTWSPPIVSTRANVDPGHPLVLLWLTLLTAAVASLAMYRLPLAGVLLGVAALVTIVTVVFGLQGLVVPLIVLMLLPIPLVTVRSASFGLASFAAPIFVAAGLLVARRRRVPVRILYRWAAVVLLTFAAVSILNSWLFWDPAVGTRQDRGFGHRWIGYQLTALYFLATPYLALMAGTLFSQLERLKVLYGGVLASLAGTAVLGLWEWWHKPVNPLDVYASGGRPNINPDATVFLIVLAAALLIWARSGRMRALAIFLLSLGLVAAYLSYFINVWLGVIGALTVIIGARWGRRGALAWLGGVAVLALAALPILATILSQRLLGSDADRIQLWEGALTIWSKSLLIGVGPGDLASYMEAYSKFSITLVLQGYQEAHNIFLELLAEIGIVGLLLFLGFVIAVLVRLARRLPEAERFDRQFRSAAAGLVVAGAIMASVGSGLVPTIATEGWTAVAPVVLTWFFAGCGIALAFRKPGAAPA